MSFVCDSTGSRGGGFSPRSIPNLALWLPARAYSLSGGVMTGADQSGNVGRDCTQAIAANQPAIIPGPPGYINCVGSGGQIQFLEGLLPIAAGSPLSVFSLTRYAGPDAVNSGETIFSTSDAGRSTSNNFFASTRQHVSTLLIGRWTLTGDVSFTDSAFVGTDVVTSDLESLADRRLYKNGVLKASSAAVVAGPAAMARYRVGHYFVQSLPWRGRIYEVLVYDRLLSASERVQVENYLKAIVGIP